MKKIALFLATLSLSAPTHAATVTIDLDRWNQITEASKTICRTGVDVPGPIVPIIDRQSSYLHLNQEEKLLLVSLCILYIKGRIDAR